MVLSNEEEIKKIQDWVADNALTEIDQYSQFILQEHPNKHYFVELAATMFAQKNDYSNAIRIYDYMFDFGYKHTQLLSNYGNVLRLNGDYEKSESWLLSAHTNAPNDPSVNFNLASLYRALGKFKEFEEYIRLVLEANPKDLEAMIQLAVAFRMTGRVQSSIQLLDYLDSSNNNVWMIKTELGLTYLAANNYDLALEYFSTSLNLNSTSNGSALLGMATCLERSSEIDAALTQLNALSDSYADNFEIILLKAICYMRKKNWYEAESMFASIDVNKVSVNLLEDYWYQLGHLNNKMDRPDAAMAAFAEAKVIARARNENAFILSYFNPNKLTQITEFYTGKPNVIKVKECDRSLAFVVGYPRSGTTLMETILDSHPDIMVYGEPRSLVPIFNKIETELGGFPQGLPKLDESLVKALRSSYWSELEKIKALDFTKIIVDKNPLYLAHVGLIKQLFPNAKFVFLQRHPFDSVLSCYMQKFKNFGFGLDLDQVAEYYHSIMTAWCSQESLVKDQMLNVRYESLVDDLEGHTKTIAQFLNLEWNEAMLSFYENKGSISSVRTPSYYQVSQKIYSDAKYRWQKYEPWMRPAIKILQPWADHFDY